MYFDAISLQCIHLIIWNLPQSGQLKIVVPFEFATFFLHDEHTNFSFSMNLGYLSFIYKGYYLRNSF